MNPKDMLNAKIEEAKAELADAKRRSNPWAIADAQRKLAFWSQTPKQAARAHSIQTRDDDDSPIS